GPEMADPSSRKRSERRRKQRIQLTRGLVASYGAMSVIVIDVSDGGARIEHFRRLDVGRQSRLNLEWNDKVIQVEAMTVSCKVHRFAPGEDGNTVFQSGLLFTDYVGDSSAALRDMLATMVARSLAEQVANARGIGPIMERNMPVFRSGQVAASGLDTTQRAPRRGIPSTGVAVDRGYLRCTLIANNRWEKKWTRTPDQPDDGFTVSMSEPSEHVDHLCDAYRKAAPEDRKLIKLMARTSVETEGDAPEPRPEPSS
ncbi:MAG: PilZ domain-containing protein, partial [Thermoanaerobaculia bacterium]